MTWESRSETTGISSPIPASQGFAMIFAVQYFRGLGGLVTVILLMEEILLTSPVEVGSLSHYLQGFFISPRGWPWDFWTINSTIGCSRCFCHCSPFEGSCSDTRYPSYRWDRYLCGGEWTGVRSVLAEMLKIDSTKDGKWWKKFSRTTNMVWWSIKILKTPELLI